LTSYPSRRTALVFAVSSALALGACGKRGDLELPGPTPSPIGGPTPPSLPPRVEASPDPTQVAQRQPGGQPAPAARRDYDPFRPVGTKPLIPNGTFILDPLL
jgi:Prokaryotic lipoprotein-attachment site